MWIHSPVNSSYLNVLRIFCGFYDGQRGTGWELVLSVPLRGLGLGEVVQGCGIATVVAFAADQADFSGGSDGSTAAGAYILSGAAGLLCAAVGGLDGCRSGLTSGGRWEGVAFVTVYLDLDKVTFKTPHYEVV